MNEHKNTVSMKHCKQLMKTIAYAWNKLKQKRI